MENKTAQHILNTSANLLGFCLIVISSLQISNKAANTLLDEFTSIIALLLAISAVFSFSSMKTKNQKRTLLFEDIADWFFMIGLIGLLLVILFITFIFVK
jgi:hypothetical protein